MSLLILSACFPFISNAHIIAAKNIINLAIYFLASYPPNTLKLVTVCIWSERDSNNVHIGPVKPYSWYSIRSHTESNVIECILLARYSFQALISFAQNKWNLFASSSSIHTLAVTLQFDGLRWLHQLSTVFNVHLADLPFSNMLASYPLFHWTWYHSTRMSMFSIKLSIQL